MTRVKRRSGLVAGVAQQAAEPLQQTGPLMFFRGTMSLGGPGYWVLTLCRLIDAGRTDV